MAARKLAVYKPAEAELVAFEKKYLSIVVDCSTTKGMKAAKDSRKEIRDARSNLEDLRKDTKAPVLTKGKQIDAEAKAITERLNILFTKFDTAIKEVENAAEIAKQKALDAALAKEKDLAEREQKIIEREIELGLRDAEVDEPTVVDDEGSTPSVGGGDSAASTVADASVICEPHIKVAGERLVALKKVRNLVEPTDPQPEGSIDTAIARKHDEVLAAIWEIVDEYA